MKIKIISDGLDDLTGTKVVDAETGELLEDVEQVSWFASVDHEGEGVFVETVIKFRNVELDVKSPNLEQKNGKLLGNNQ